MVRPVIGGPRPAADWPVITGPEDFMKGEDLDEEVVLTELYLEEVGVTEEPERPWKVIMLVHAELQVLEGTPKKQKLVMEEMYTQEMSQGGVAGVDSIMEATSPGAAGQLTEPSVVLRQEQ